MECVFCTNPISCESILPDGAFCIRCPVHGIYAIESSFGFKKFLQQIDKEEGMRKCEQLLFEYNNIYHTPILFCWNNLFHVDGYNSIWLREFIASFPLEAGDLFDRSFRNMVFNLNHPADTFGFSESSNPIFFARKFSDARYVINQFLTSGYLAPVTNSTILPIQYSITAKGWEYYSKIKNRPLGSSTQVFVAMWFHPDRDSVYKEGIKPAIENGTNYKCIKINNVEHNNKICDQIIAEIRKSKFMVADFTGNRGGVYFEAGFAQGLGIPVIWIVDEKEIDNIHFDTRQYNHITYKDAEDLRVKLRARIEATIV